MTIYQLGNKKIERHENTWTAHNSVIIGDVTLKENSSIWFGACLLYTSPSPRDVEESRMPSSA